MTKELPKIYRFKSTAGIDAEVEFIYPRLPSRCKTCSKWGHGEKDCVGKGSKKSAVVFPSTTVEGAQDQNTEAGKSKQGSEGVEANANLIEDADIASGLQIDDAAGTETESSLVASTLEKMVAVTGQQDAEEGIWSKVSPNKSGRASSIKVPEMNTVGSPSRFSILNFESEDRKAEEDDIGEGRNAATDTEAVGQEIAEKGTEETEDGEILNDDSKVTPVEERTRKPLPRSTKGANKHISTSLVQKPSAFGTTRSSRKK